MKYVFRFLALALVLFGGAAQAQYQVQNHAVPVGRGGGVSGFGASLGASGQALFGVTGSDPVFRAPTGTDLGVPTCSVALTYSAGVFGCSTSPLSTLAPPGGRLSLVSGSDTMNADAIGAQNVYYVPSSSNNCPIYNGTAWANYSIGSQLTLALAGSANWPAGTVFDVFCVLNGGVPVLATRAWDASMLPAFSQISNSGLTTITTGTSGSVWTSPANAFNGTTSQSSATAAVTNSGNANLNNCLGQDMGVGVTKVLTKVTIWSPTDTSYRGDNPTTVVMDTYGSNDNTNWQRLDPTRNVLSTAAVEGTSYSWNINAVDATPYRYFRVCTTGNGANANRFAQIQFFTTTPASTRRLIHDPNSGLLVNDATITARISASSTISVPVSQATYLGSFQTDAATAGQVTVNFSYGASRVFNLWNYYYRKNVVVTAGIPALNSAVPASATFNYTLSWPATQDWVGAQSSTSFSATVLVGYADTAVDCKFARAWYINANAGFPGAYEFGCGLDTTTVFTGSEGGLTGDGGATGSTLGYYGRAGLTMVPAAGPHTFYGIEKLSYNPTATVQAFMNIGNTGLYVSTQY